MTIEQTLDSYLRFLGEHCPALPNADAEPTRSGRVREWPGADEKDVLFIEDLTRELRVSRSTIERRRRSNSFPIPEMPPLNNRPRWSRKAVEQYKRSTNKGLLKRRKAP